MATLLPSLTGKDSLPAVGTTKRTKPSSMKRMGSWMEDDPDEVTPQTPGFEHGSSTWLFRSDESWWKTNTNDRRGVQLDDVEDDDDDVDGAWERRRDDDQSYLLYSPTTTCTSTDPPHSIPTSPTTATLSSFHQTPSASAITSSSFFLSPQTPWMKRRPSRLALSTSNTTTTSLAQSVLVCSVQVTTLALVLLFRSFEASLQWLGLTKSQSRR